MHGEGHYKARLSEKDVRKIRTDTRQLRAIAADYGVVITTISAIKHRKIWRHVD